MSKKKKAVTDNFAEDIATKLVEKNLERPIEIKGARMHNLKNVSVNIPRNQLVVVTGVSGSGKSSLTIDTLYAEGLRRYAESLSAYARQFLNRLDKPDVDYIKGLCPAIAIEQKVTSRTPRSTVGSMTEIYDYLKLLFARIGRTYSPVSGKEVTHHSIDDVVKWLQQLPEGEKIYLLTPVTIKDKKRTRLQELQILMQKGFSRVAKLQPDFEVYDLEELTENEGAALNTLPKNEILYVLIDRLIKGNWDEDELHRLNDSLETAFFEGEGRLFVYTGATTLSEFSTLFEADGIQFEQPIPNLFSFNNSYGACPVCEGFGQVFGIDPNLVIPDKTLSVYESAVAPWNGEKMSAWRKEFIRVAGKEYDFPVHQPVMDLTAAQYKLLWEGNNRVQGIRAFFAEVEQNLYKIQYRVLLSRYRGRTTCPECKGYKLRKEALYVKINGKHIAELNTMPVQVLQQWFNGLERKLTDFEKEAAKRILIEINSRLKTLMEVGLKYLTLSRTANTLSGGESQRIQLTRSLGSNLSDSLYILDEPSIGLHSRDTQNLIKVLEALRDLNNTVVVVEHDEMMMREADHIIDMGPYAAYLGGEVVAEGNYQAIVNNPASITGKYLNAELVITRKQNLKKSPAYIKVEGARHNNLKNIDVVFLLNRLCLVTGVSGSGKTTLVKQILYPALQKIKTGVAETAGLHKKISGNFEAFTLVEMVDQNPIGKSSRSNPLTYIKAYDSLRELFSIQPLSKMRGYLPKHFSFNVEGGRCDACNGEGEQVIEMQFLADVHLTCEVCRGRRFKEEILEVNYKGKSIFDVLELSVDDAITFFSAPGAKAPELAVAKAIQPLSDVGLGYVKLGQSSSTLSGGEAQRVKLASFLGKGRSAQKVLFIFDEPTTGLHFHDIQKLLNSFDALIEQGHSIIVIEHNTEVIKCADWVIDLGPEAGDEGGNLVFEGLPADLKKIKESYTGQYL